jgi:hypothetical protein
VENTGIELLGYESEFGKVTAVKRCNYLLPPGGLQVNEKPPEEDPLPRSSSPYENPVP